MPFGYCALLDTLNTAIIATRQAIAQHIDTDPTLKQQAALLTSIPGIGPATSAALLALLGDVQRFATKKHATSLPGCARQNVSPGNTAGRPA